MEPVAGKWFSGGGLALGDFVFMVRENVVHAAGMDVER